MLATIQGVKFLSHKKFKKLRNIQGRKIIELAEIVVAENLQKEIALVKAGHGLVQQETRPLLALSEAEVDAMNSKELSDQHMELNFPRKGKVAE